MSPCEPDFNLFDKTLSNPNYLPLYMTVDYLFHLCLFKVGRQLCKLAIPTIYVSSIFSQVQKRNILCSGEYVKQNIKDIVRVFYSSECLCGILHFRSTVGCQMSTLYCIVLSGSLYCFVLSIQCVECKFKVIFLLLVTRSL